MALLQDLVSYWANNDNVEITKSSDASGIDNPADEQATDIQSLEASEATLNRITAGGMIFDDGGLISGGVCDPDHLSLPSECAAQPIAQSKPDIPMTEGNSNDNAAASSAENDVPKAPDAAGIPHGNERNVAGAPSVLSLSNIKVSPAMRKRGRPKGHTLTVIGLPKRRKLGTKEQGPFKSLSMQEKRRIILVWLVGKRAAKAAIQGKKLEEEDVVQKPENLHCGILDENVDVNAVCSYFSDDAWLAVKNVLNSKQQLQQWECSTCKTDLGAHDSVL
ncbi:hypothetical protein HPB50_005193 [Hyalomma asiaticum]|uniref:Uncharacterized protein n=1 Tax=Hyalomma asiaticum TaxID=266040 RepID=A0ACB7S513_HYAAI|nr:hypothetical protein HPB50_005193 [Hyalomma asiaticum]